MRLLGRTGTPLPQNPPDAFVDDAGSPHEPAINQLAAAGIVNGTGAGTFSPSSVVNRAQMASFVVKVVDLVARADVGSGHDAFSDDDGSVHEPAIDEAAVRGIVVGDSSRRYNPQSHVARDQMATFLVRGLAVMAGARP